jgi:Metallo-beta-lactamase superfamily
VRVGELALEPDLLYMFAFGPGFGESIVLRIPPDEWMVVDSLRRQTRGQDFNPALSLLEAHEATIAAIALTHPHSDHVRGLPQLLERRRRGGPVGHTGILAIPDERWQVSQDARLVLDTGGVGAVLNRIDHIWRTEPSSKWPLIDGATRRIGDAIVEVLFPQNRDRPPPRDLNSLSSPMLVAWHDCHILLGADLPAVQWRSIPSARQAVKLASSHALKAAHHGSKRAQHPTAIGAPPPRDRVCVVTPFNRGQQLPSYADEHGIDLLLRTHLEVGVTTVPHQARGAMTPRKRLQPTREQFGELTLAHETPVASPDQAWIATAFDYVGKRAGVWYGDAAGTVIA